MDRPNTLLLVAVGLLFVAALGSGLTGFQVEENEDVFGEYRFLPSFDVPSPDREMWTTLPETVFTDLIEEIKECEVSGTMTLSECVDEATDTINGVQEQFTLSPYGCTAGEKTLYMIAERLDECAQATSPCDCQLPGPPGETVYGQGNLLRGEIEVELQHASLFEEGLLGPGIWLRSSNGGLIPLDSAPAEPEVCPEISRTRLFCAESEQEVEYSGEEGISSEPVQYWFALQFPDATPPPPLTQLSAIDEPVAERSLVVTFDESPAEDVAKYHLYTGTNLLQERELLELDPAVTKTTFTSIQELPEEVSFDDYSSLQEDTLYTDGEQMYLLLSVDEDGVPLQVGALAEDQYGNMIDNLNTRMPVVTATSIDDLPPAPVEDIFAEESFFNTSQVDVEWTYYFENIDGSEAIDIEAFEIYMNDVPDTLGQLAAEVSPSEAGCGVSFASTDCGATVPKEGNYVSIIVRDDDGNRVEEDVFSVSVLSQ